MFAVTFKMPTLLSMSIFILEIGTARLQSLTECVTKEDAFKHLLPVLRNRLSLYEIFVCSLTQPKLERKLTSVRQKYVKCFMDF